MHVLSIIFFPPLHVKIRRPRSPFSGYEPIIFLHQ